MSLSFSPLLVYLSLIILPFYVCLTSLVIFAAHIYIACVGMSAMLTISAYSFIAKILVWKLCTAVTSDLVVFEIQHYFLLCFSSLTMN